MPDTRTRSGGGAAEKVFAKVAGSDTVAFEALVAGVERYRRSKPADREWCNPATWLNQGRWSDEPALPLGAPSPPSTEPRIDFGGGVIWPERTVLMQVEHWCRDSTTWPTDRLGPPPGEPGCRVPDHLVEETAPAAAAPVRVSTGLKTILELDRVERREVAAE